MDRLLRMGYQTTKQTASFIIILSVMACIFTLSLPAKADSDIEILADRFEVDALKQELNAVGHVKVARGEIDLFGSSAIYNKKTKQLEIKGPITLKSKTLLLKCDTLFADGIANTITAKGTVKFTFNKITGKSDQAIYDIPAQTVTLTGHPKAWQGNDYIAGEKIMLLIEKNKLVTSGNTKLVFSEERLQKK